MSKALDNTTPRSGGAQVISTETTGSHETLTSELDDYIGRLTMAQNAVQLVRAFSNFSDLTGGFVRVLPEFQYIPVLLGTNQKAIPLYEFVEVLDGALDYDAVMEELPDLAYPQISGAISFLRKIAQCNPRNVDFDALEDRKLSEDSAFLDELRHALAEEETSRVLPRD